MKHEYPHIDDTAFPDIASVDVYKYENEYDYSLYTDSVTIKMLNVSWCSDYENVVFFESKDARNTWFDSQDGIVKELSSMFRLYNDGSIKVDIPIDECMQYNYVMIDYGKLPQQTTATKDSKMFYFISGIVQASVNATELMLSVDYWTSYINDMNVQYVNLTRGHWPLAQTTVANYLANPLDNSEFLLTDDVNYGDFNRVASSNPIILNDSSDQYLCFASNGYLDASEDNDANWENKVFTREYMHSELISNVCCYATNLSNWGDFKAAITASAPQFWQTVKSMFICPAKLLTFSQTNISFCGQTMAKLTSIGSKEHATRGMTKDIFGYTSFTHGDKISELAKLYTYPYAAIEVNDFKGNSMMIKIEDTSGTLKLNTVMSDMYPFINVEAYFNGIGSGTSSELHFQNVSDNTLVAGGKFYDFSTKWSIPVFAVQLTDDADWALNGDIGATSVYDSAYANAKLTTDNAALQVGTNSANVALANTLINSKKTASNTLQGSNTINTNQVLSGTANNEIEAASSQASVSTNALQIIASNTASTSLGNSQISAVAGAIGGLVDVATGNVTGGINAGVSGIAQVMSATNSYNNAITNAATQAAATIQSMTIANGLIASNVSINTSANTATNTNIQNFNTNNATYETTYNTEKAGNDNDLTASAASNTSGVSKANADRTYNASHDQKLINNHPQFGQLTGTPDIIDKPFGFNFNIITQSKNAIRQTAEQFLRYGYMLNMEVDITSFNVMPNFTYWQCDKVYCNDRGVFGGAQDVIKSILNSGTTVWRDPAKIGVTSIYDNLEVS